MAAALAVIVAAALLFAGWRHFSSAPAAPDATPTLAVLPFADLSPQRDKAYFAEGVAEEILSTIARDSGIRIIGRSSAAQLRQTGGSADLATMKRSLGVTHVLEGSARTHGDQLRMSVRLIDASSGRQLWAQDFK